MLRHRLLPLATALAGTIGAAWWLAGAIDARRAARVPRVEHYATGGAGPAVAIVAIGTSLTHGQQWTRRFARDLSVCLGRPVRLRVAAIPGATSRWGMRWLPALLDPAPDIALVEFVSNDADWRRGLLPGASVRNLNAMLTRLDTVPGIRVAVIAMPDPVGSRRWLLRPGIGSYQARHAAAARAHGAGHPNVRDWSRHLSPGERAAWLRDGLHPDPAALARLLAPVLIRHMCVSRFR